jgi:basic membrane lipoprotein Med (substrate-binding protein (PBP1-ABC) superfamily)
MVARASRSLQRMRGRYYHRHGMDFENAVVIRTFDNTAVAAAAVSLLVSEGIDAIYHADDAGGELPNLDLAQGVRVLVAAEDEARARAVLDANDRA